MKVRKLSRIAAGVGLAALLLGAAGLWLAARASQRPVQAGLADGRLRPCPPTPNCVCSEDPDPERRVPAFATEDGGGDPGAAFASLVSHVQALEEAEALQIGEDYAHFVFRTPLLGFADDLELRLDAGAGLIHVRSSSRVGRSDLGANERRVERLREGWQPLQYR